MLEEQEDTGVWYLVEESEGQGHIHLKHKQKTIFTFTKQLKYLNRTLSPCAGWLRKTTTT